MGDGRLFLVGQLYACTHVRAEVGLAADEQDPRAGAEVLDLCLPLPQRGESFRKQDGHRRVVATASVPSSERCRPCRDG